jgi:PAS domain S-box-containing protein
MCLAVVSEIKAMDGQPAHAADEASRNRRALEAEIAARKRAEEELARVAAEILRQKELLAATLASIGDGVIVTDTRGQVTLLNRKAEGLTGWTNQEVEGLALSAVFNVIDEPTRRPLEDPVETALRLGTVESLADGVILVARDGREIPIDKSGALIRQSDGTVQGVVLVFRDCTEEKQAVRSLARLAAIVESSDDGIVSKDLNGIIQTWNAGAERLFGYRAEEIIGQPITRLLPPERIQEEEYILEHVRSGQRVEHLDTVRVAKDGRRLDVSITISPVKDREGRIIGASKIARDITERKRAEESLQRAKEAAEAANVAKSQFLANMSHELRTPMNAILGMIDVALPKAIEPTVRDCLQTAKGSADLLLALLNDLLDSAKIDSGKLELESAPFSLRRMLEQITRILALRASEKGLRFSCQLPEPTLDGIVGDRMRLQQVLLNLAGNAIKFTEYGDVRIGVRGLAREGDAWLEFEVRDTGIGIPPAVQQCLFQPFAQADASMSRRFGGTGLGLSICKNLIELMGGHIWVESELGKGSTFHFTLRLPLTKDLPSGSEEPGAAAASACVRRRILVVEDNPANQKLASYVLAERGHLVEVARDGREAISLTQSNRYDVILMDVQMPGTNGLEATAAIRNREAGAGRTPIIALTAHATRRDRDRCLAAGMDAYLSKPINAQEMIALVESLAGGLAPAVAPAALSESPSRPSSPVFDAPLALKRCAGREDLLGEMAQCFLEEFRQLAPQIRAALEMDDLAEVGRLGHRLKGTIAYLGAKPAENAAVAVEEAGQGGGKTEAEEAVRALEDECDALGKVLAAFRPTAGR